MNNMTLIESIKREVYDYYTNLKESTNGIEPVYCDSHLMDLIKDSAANSISNIDEIGKLSLPLKDGTTLIIDDEEILIKKNNDMSSEVIFENNEDEETIRNIYYNKQQENAEKPTQPNLETIAEAVVKRYINEAKNKFSSVHFDDKTGYHKFSLSKDSGNDDIANAVKKHNDRIRQHEEDDENKPETIKQRRNNPEYMEKVRKFSDERSKRPEPRGNFSNSKQTNMLRTFGYK